MAALDSRQEDLLRSLSTHAAAFECRNHLQKLLNDPVRIALSEFSKRSNLVYRQSVPTFWGGKMDVTLPEPVSVFLYRYGYYEEGLTSFLIRALKPGECFMDIGSHYGYFSLLAAHLVGAKGRVVAFDPTPRTFAVLKSNTQTIPQISIENLAAWSSDTTMELTDLGIAWSSHNSLKSPKMIPDAIRGQGNRYVVRAVQLDPYIKTHSLRPALMKIDAESAELEILKGLSETLTTIRPIVSIEVGDDRGAGVLPDSREVLNFAASFDYVPIGYENGRLTRHEFVDSYSYDNVFMVPRERAAEFA